MLHDFELPVLLLSLYSQDGGLGVLYKLAAKFQRLCVAI